MHDSGLPQSAERRWASVMMLDMAGSTELQAQLGAEQSYELAREVISLAISIAKGQGGHVMGVEGDSLLASFGAPIASEDAALGAVQAAVEFRDRAAVLADSWQARFGVSPEFRTAICDGPVVVDRGADPDGGDLRIHGPPVNLSARLQARAAPGQILLSAQTAHHLEGAVVAPLVGEHVLKGFADPVKVHELVELIEDGQRFDARRRRGLVPLVGRVREVAQLDRFLSQDAGGWHLAVLQGAAGIGKSRLLHEIRDRHHVGHTFLTAQCDAGQRDAPFAPLVQLLRQAANVREDAPPEEVARVLKEQFGFDAGGDRLVLALGGGSGMVTPGLGGMDTMVRLREALRGALEAISARSPTVMVIEDVHWIDRSSRMLIASILANPGALGRCALLVTTRPDGADWLEVPNRLQVAVSPLDRAQIQQLCEAALPWNALTAQQRQLVHEKSEGNPLFAEEILRFLATAGHKGPDQTLDPAATLGNLQFLFLQQIDHLPDPVRRVLQMAAVIGPSFDRDLLAALHSEEMQSKLPAHLDRAEAAGLIRPVSQGTTVRYSFAHVLLRDAVYSSLLEVVRRDHHLAVARKMQQLGLAVRPENALPVAEHFDRAGHAGEALPHWLSAARRAMGLYALEETDAILTRVVEVARTAPEQLEDTAFAAAFTDWLEALQYMGNFQRLVDVAREFLPRLQALSDPSHASLALAHYSLALTHLRDYAGAERIARAALLQAEARGDRRGAAWLTLPLIRAQEETLSLSETDYLARTEALFDEAHALGDTRLAIQYIYMRAAYLRSMGDVRAARKENHRLAAYAMAQKDMRGRAFAGWTEALCRQVGEEIEEALEVIADSRRHVLPGSADALVLDTIWSALQALGPDPAAHQPFQQRVLQQATELGDMNLVHPTRLMGAVTRLRLRQLRAGWRELTQLLRDTEAGGNKTHLRYFQLVTVEFLLVVAGALPPSLPTPPNLARMGVGDAALGVALRLTARRRARRLLARLETLLPGGRDGAVKARALICKAALAKGRERRALLERARAIAVHQDLPNMVRRIDVLHGQAASDQA